MTISISSQTFTRDDRLGVAAWRTVFKIATAITRLGKVNLPGTCIEHAYGSHPDERLDFIEAANNVTFRTPVVYIHSGG